MEDCRDYCRAVLQQKVELIEKIGMVFTKNFALFLSRDTKIKNKMKNTRLERMMD